MINSGIPPLGSGFPEVYTALGGLVREPAPLNWSAPSELALLLIFPDTAVPKVKLGELNDKLLFAAEGCEEETG